VNIRASIKNLLLKAGYDAVRTDNFVKYPPARQTKLLKDRGINLIFDVGANTGQFAGSMRKLGYTGKIVSFEPLSNAYKELQKQAAIDPAWETVNVALGDEEGEKEINISGNSYSSSLLDMKEKHLEASQSAKYIGKETIVIKTMDSIFPQYFTEGDKLFLKLDTQGYERFVLEGAAKSLEQVICVRMEMSLTTLYEGELLMPDMVNWMMENGFVLWSLEDEYHNPETGQLLQVNGLFVRPVS